MIKTIALMIPLLMVSATAHAEPLDDMQHMQARLKIAEVCQDLSFYLVKHPDADLQAHMNECTPDEMEYEAMIQCRDTGIPASECPVTELMILYTGILQAVMQ